MSNILTPKTKVPSWKVFRVSFTPVSVPSKAASFEDEILACNRLNVDSAKTGNFFYVVPQTTR